jgi:endonuclease III
MNMETASLRSIREILKILEKQYGSRRFEPHHDPISELVLTILSQNTADTNSRPAFQALRQRFTSYEDILEASIEQIEEPIKGGGLGRIKAQRIREALRNIKDQRGKLDLDFLNAMTVPEARDWLISLPGVGYKTASCVLLFAFGMPVLPVDTHIFRVSGRLGLIQAKATLKEAHEKLGRLVPPAEIYEFHVLIIEHGRRTCTAQRPRCTQCALSPVCPAYQLCKGSKLE